MNQVNQVNQWQAIGTIKPDTLTEARLQLHYAIQFIAATGSALAEPLPDYSHSSLSWHPILEAFVGSIIRATNPFQVAVDPISLTLILLNPRAETIASLPLQGVTMVEGLSWLQKEVSKVGADASKIKFLTYPPDDFPDHPLAHGASFNANYSDALNELADYYANTHLLLQEIVETAEDATAIHIWPHHFDMATLIMLPGTQNGNPPTIGVGFSPGDTSYSEPYWYVSPYPYPATDQLPALLSNGFWHTQHWVGAVLPASRLSYGSTDEAQQQQVSSFLQSAVEAAIELLRTPN